MELIYSSVKEVWKNKTEIASALSLLGAFKFLYEYSRENKRKRIETYVAMQDKIAEDRNIKIVSMLARYRAAEGDVKVRVAGEIFALPLEERMRFAFLLEDIAMRTNSGLVRRDVISEIFGWLSCTRFRRHRVRCFMEQEVCHGETAVYAGVQA